MRGHLRQNLYVTSIPDKYEFIALAMAVTGIVTVLKWDKILPDSQDYLNLAPAAGAAAKYSAGERGGDCDCGDCLLGGCERAPRVVVPAVRVGRGRKPLRRASCSSPRRTAACVMLASLFTFCAVFALLGALGAVLPRQMFRTVSPWARGFFLVAFIMLLISGFAGTALIGEALLKPNSPLRYVPSLWFLGLYQSMQHVGPSRLAAMAPMALWGSAAAFFAMVAAYGLSYRRRFAASLESFRSPGEQRIFALMVAGLDLFAERTAGFPRACHRFVVRAILRNESHRLSIAVALGLGYFLAFQSASETLTAGAKGRDLLPEGPVLQAPLIAAYLLILGLRLAFDLPAGVPANWVFRSILDSRENETVGVARRVILSFLTPLVLLPSLALSVWRWGIVTGVVQTLYVLAVSLCLIEILIAGYRKVPLTCPTPGFRDNLLMLCLMLLLGFELFTRLGAATERWMFDEPWRFPLLPAAMLGGWWWNRRRIREAREAGELEEGLTFENIRRPVVERMDLS